jgi:hypothetical protein
MRFEFLGQIALEGAGTQTSARGHQLASTLARLVRERPSPPRREDALAALTSC